MSRPSLPLAILLVVGGIVGLIAAFALTLDKIAVLEDPNFNPSCNFSVLVQCGTNLRSAQGSAFGFPNPLLGLMMFPAPILVGVASIAGTTVLSGLELIQPVTTMIEGITGATA